MGFKVVLLNHTLCADPGETRGPLIMFCLDINYCLITLLTINYYIRLFSGVLLDNNYCLCGYLAQQKWRGVGSFSRNGGGESVIIDVDL